jgi:hypothetical protein
MEIWYTGLMRPSLLFAALGGYFLLATVPVDASTRVVAQSDHTEAVVEQTGELHGSDLLLHEIERIRLRGTIDDCLTLEPIPLYDHAPSFRDWNAYCIARVSSDRAACGDIPGMIVPDLRSQCERPFSPSTSHAA